MTNSMLRNLNALGLLGITIILAMGLVVQIVLNELPCPLCLLQRIGFALVMFGFMLNVVQGSSYHHYGLVIISALFGASVSLRQVLLHIVPGTGTYGSPILGLHIYTWAFVLFVATLLAVGIMLVASRNQQPEVITPMTSIQRAICWAAVMVLFANVVSTFLECGPLVCADNPVAYKLLS